ncbi:MAG: acyl-CoA/acyl-ACP dehydrogenase [Caulobacteraceae bacterium]|nr:acyl-CoA/acyl-ACP dehydrogenase [Caulobacter sp.]
MRVGFENKDEQVSMLDRPQQLLSEPSGAAGFAWQELADLCAVLSAEAAAGDAARAITPAAWNALRRSGLLRAPFSPADGGSGLMGDDRHTTLVRVLRNLGAADLSMGRLVEGHMNAVLLVQRYGSRSQSAALAEAVGSGGFSGVWGAEGVAPLQARRGEGGWLLEGGKVFASGAGFVTHPLVPAATDDGQRLMMPVLQQGERVDVSGWTAQGMRATATGAVDLTGMFVPDAMVIGHVGDFTRQPAFSGGAWRFCAVHLGAAERLVDLLREHLVSRNRGADPFQLQRVAQATTAVTTARFWIAEAARLLAEGASDPDTVVAFANLTRGVTERAALDVLELVHRGVGLGGFLHPHPVERISRDLATYLRQPVPDLAMADAARAILASGRDTADLWAEAE